MNKEKLNFPPGFFKQFKTATDLEDFFSLKAQKTNTFSKKIVNFSSQLLSILTLIIALIYQGASFFSFFNFYI